MLEPKPSHRPVETAGEGVDGRTPPGGRSKAPAPLRAAAELSPLGAWKQAVRGGGRGRLRRTVEQRHMERIMIFDMKDFERNPSLTSRVQRTYEDILRL